MNRHFHISSSYRKAFGVAFVLQTACILGSGFLLDEGFTLHLCLIALAAYWLGAGLMIWRRPDHPTDVDLSLIRIGYPLLMMLALFIAPFIWHLRA